MVYPKDKPSVESAKPDDNEKTCTSIEVQVLVF